MQTINEIGQFLWAVIYNWAGLSTGGVIVALVGFWHLLKNQPIPRRLGFVLAVFFLISGFFLAWQDQHRALLWEQQKNSMPQLSETLDQFLGAPGRSYDESLLAIFATVRNTGAESIAEDFELQVKTIDGRTIDGFRLPPPSEKHDIFMAAPGSKTTGVTLRRADSLEENALLHPIPHNGAAEGFEMFQIPLPQSKLWRVGNVLTLSFVDIYGNKYSGTHEITGGELAIPNLSHLQ